MSFELGYYRRMWKRGFSLLELLVVISIMGILMALSSAAYTTAQRRSRDARRRTETKAIQSGYEQYYAQNGDYGTANDCSDLYDDSTYMPAGQPVDPKNDPDYFYTCESTGDSYCACAHLEAEDGGNSSDDQCSYGSGDYFCVNNLQ